MGLNISPQGQESSMYHHHEYYQTTRSKPNKIWYQALIELKDKMDLNHHVNNQDHARDMAYEYHGQCQNMSSISINVT